MCGIAGVVALRDGAPPPELPELEAMAAALRHRGPDEFGLYRDQRAGLAHARLSIIDVATGQQPMTEGHGTLWIVFNGEVFNYLELREELAALGYRFRTRSDTEVVVSAYHAWREKAFQRFNGQFALAIWDPARASLVLARDRHGIQPLYFSQHAGRLWFASEVKAIFAGAPAMARAVDPAGLSQTLTFWSIAPPQSIFQGIRELEPGHFCTISAEGIHDRAYWWPRPPAAAARGFAASVEEATERVRASLEEAVRLRMLRADVPVGTYLSGGLDSSLLAALAHRAKSDRFSTFSMRFEDAEFDETRYQRAVAEAIGSEHRELLVRRRDIAAAFPDVVFHAERPILRTAPAPLFLLSRLVRDTGTKVVLTGEGADEIFAGYDLFREGKIRRFWARQPASRMRPRLLARLYPYLARSPVSQQAMAQEFFGRGLEHWRQPGFAHQTRWKGGAALHRLLQPEWRRQCDAGEAVNGLLANLPREFSCWSFLAQDQYLETRTLLSGYLLSSQGDRMLMAHSVEGRFPYLDADLIELAGSLPDSYKLRVLDEKHVLKRAALGMIPEDIRSRQKQPYRAPDAVCFTAADAPDWVREVIAPGALAQAGLFDAAAVQRLWSKCRRGAQPSNTDNMALCAVLSTQLLHHQFIRHGAERRASPRFRTLVDRLAPAGQKLRQTSQT